MAHLLMFASILFTALETVHCQQYQNGNQNVALHKTTRQSSVFYGFVSDLAVDGDIRQRLNVPNKKFCSHTDLYDDVFWWTVDLEETFSITSVVVYGRTDNCVERLSNFEVVLYNPKKSLATWDDYTKSDDFVMHRHNIVTLPAVIRINCSDMCIGRYVKIQISNKNAVPANVDGRKALTLCEVEVYGEIYHSTTTHLAVSNSLRINSDATTEVTGNRNAALHKSTRQSSLYGNLISELAVDGNITQFLYIPHSHTLYPTCAHTGFSDDVFWWAVDLEDTFSITKIVVYGRTDCCGERLSYFEVLLYNPEDSMAKWDCYSQSNPFLMYTHDFGTQPAIIHINCSSMCIGRYVRIQIDNETAVPNGLDGKKALTLCEVEVYGEIYHPTTPYLWVNSDVTTKAQEMCQCPCKEEHADPNQLKLVGNAVYKISDIIKTLKVNKTMLSKTRRSKMSSHDGRVSSQYIGICGSAILIFIPGLIICSDLFTLINKWK